MDVDERLCPSLGNWVIARLYALPRRAICPQCKSKIPDGASRLQRQVSSLSELGVAQASRTREQRIAESTRGDRRDKLLAQLLTIGPEADLVKPGCAEERIGAYAASKGAASLGLILIEKSPVRWLNLVEVAARKRRLAKVLSVAEALWGEPLGAKRGPIQTFECLLADPRLSAAAARVRILTRPPGLLDAAESTRQLGPWQEGSGEYLQSRAGRNPGGPDRGGERSARTRRSGGGSQSPGGGRLEYFLSDRGGQRLCRSRRWPDFGTLAGV